MAVREFVAIKMVCLRNQKDQDRIGFISVL